MTESTFAVAEQQSQWLSLGEVKRQVNLVQEIMREVMKDGEHYGTVPGCGPKKALLKPGAEKLCFTFQLVATFIVERRDLPNNHREYQVTCRLSTRSGTLIAEGIGCCSSMESKYRYRGAVYENTGKPLPRDYWDLKKSPDKGDQMRAVELLGGKGFVAKKLDDGWFIHKTTGEKSEHPDITDVMNTILKMGKKRAHVDATITALAASDIFAQDIDDDYELPVEAAKPDPTPVKPAETIVPAAPATPQKESIGDEVKRLGERLTILAGQRFARMLWKAYAATPEKMADQMKAAIGAIDQITKAMPKDRAEEIITDCLINGQEPDNAERIVADLLAVVNTGLTPIQRANAAGEQPPH